VKPDYLMQMRLENDAGAAIGPSRFMKSIHNAIE
jgi:hypothetical protein